MHKSATLRQLFSGHNVIRTVGAHDGISAKLIEQNGFDGVWASGLEISTSHAVPDANILTMSEYLERACEMNNAVAIPVIADCDTGYGNANNVIHMVQKYEAAGIAAVCIEDKLFPKVNSYVPGRQELAPIGEFVGKIMAAKSAQSNPDFMVVARVEALIAGWGMDEALKRARNYAEAGADAILIHSKSDTPDEIREFCQKWSHEAPVVIVPTTYPQFHIDEMRECGIKMTIYANHGLRASIKAMNEVFCEIKKSGRLSAIDNKIVPMSDVFELQGMTRMIDLEKEFLYIGAESISVIIPAAGDPSYEKTMEGVVKDFPVAMLDINGKSILKRNIETLNSLRISDITVITGYNADKFDIQDINYVRNDRFRETSQADSILLAKDKLNNKVLIIFSDIIFDKEIIEKLVGSGQDIVLAIDSSISSQQTVVDYVKAEFPPISSSRRISPRRLNRILEIDKKLAKQEANFEFIGLSYFSRKGIQVFREYHSKLQDASRSNRERSSVDFLDVIQFIIDQGVEVSGAEVSGGWIEIRNLANYRLAHSIF